MKSKQEQLKRAEEIIIQQGLELVEKYGWDKTIVEAKASELFRHAKKEIEYAGDCEDLSQCWDLAGFTTCLSWSLKGSYEDEDKSNAVRHVIYKFDYIQETPIKSVDIFLSNDNNEDIVVLGDKETNRAIKVSAEDIVNKVEKVGEYEAAKALYSLFANHIIKIKEN